MHTHHFESDLDCNFFFREGLSISTFKKRFSSTNMLFENADLPDPGYILIKMELVMRLYTCDLSTREHKLEDQEFEVSVAV